VNSFLNDISYCIVIFFFFEDFEIIDEALKEGLLFHTSKLG
jgi:hypothetical protein